MNIVVFDTETVNLNQPFCYDIGVIGYDTIEQKILFERQWIIEQVWHNLPLFATAYYTEKRELYVSKMRSKKARLDKFGYAAQKMIRLFQDFDIQQAYAYNSPFDERVFNFNCDWYKVKNPFDNIPIYDIRGYVHEKIAFTVEYQAFCEKHKLFTESGNYSTTAENIYRFLINSLEFDEEHTGLEDSKIELDILKHCIDRDSEWGVEHKIYASIPRKVIRQLTVNDKRNDKIYIFDYEKRRNSEKGSVITLT